MRFDDATLSFQRNYAERHAALVIAKANFQRASEDLDKHIKQLMLQHGMGQDALVRHVHRAAGHGNLSDKGVISRVVNACSLDGKRVHLRVQLGSVKGGLSSAYAFLDVDDVQVVTERSTRPYSF